MGPIVRQVPAASLARQAACPMPLANKKSTRLGVQLQQQGGGRRQLHQLRDRLARLALGLHRNKGKHLGGEVAGTFTQDRLTRLALGLCAACGRVCVLLGDSLPTSGTCQAAPNTPQHPAAHGVRLVFGMNADV